MNIDCVKLACFSPTGTTRTVLKAIAAGIGCERVELVDITSPAVRAQPLQTTNRELLILGVPVYMGRIPALLSPWLEALQAQGTPVVCVVVYGNREYENALLELKDTAVKRGGIPVGAGVYIGEHSFSNEQTPSRGRPDTDDIAHARRFGETLRRKLDALDSLETVEELPVPGEFPYAGRTTLWDVDFIHVSESCTQCGLCADICPMGAIDAQQSSIVDQVACITCCACLKQCPQQARSIKPGPVQDAQHRINTLFVERREPENYS